MTEYLTPAEAAKILRVTRRSVFNYLRTGKLKASKTVTGYWRIPAEEIDRFLGITPAQNSDPQ